MKETETQKAIEAEAKELYPDGGNFALLRRQGFIAGRSKSLARERELEEALRELKKENDELKSIILSAPKF